MLKKMYVITKDCVYNKYEKNELIDSNALVSVGAFDCRDEALAKCIELVKKDIDNAMGEDAGTKPKIWIDQTQTSVMVDINEFTIIYNVVGLEVR